jgi:acyl-CoA thioester hydrolase
MSAGGNCVIVGLIVLDLLGRLAPMESLLRLPAPFIGTHRVVAEEIDEYQHVNNAVYLQWLDTIAWAHSAALGLPLERCLALRRGMAIRHTRVDYLEAALLGDDLLLGTWIIASDGRLRCRRRFDILRIADGRRVLEAEIEYFCLNLDSGKPGRFAAEFVDRYAVLPPVATAYAALPDSARHTGHSRTDRQANGHAPAG